MLLGNQLNWKSSFSFLKGALLFELFDLLLAAFAFLESDVFLPDCAFPLLALLAFFVAKGFQGLK